ncbi:MAG: hypothetical protein K5873_06995 [Treponema sp.]|nr:hypothetical protein [Treponema sp.]
MVNTDSATDSAPSPLMYSLGLGGDFLFSSNIFLQTHASFFTNYYLWDGEESQPAEVENRTATALSALLDLTGGYSWLLGQNKNHLLSLGGGLGFLFRYGLLSSGVSSDDKNRNGQSTASQDLSDINSSFYSNLAFLYPELSLTYSYALSEIWKIGGEFRTYLPLGSLINGKGIDGMIFALSFKLSYK